MVPLEYTLWREEVTAAITRLCEKYTPNPNLGILDAGTAYSLGWTAERTARALLGFHYDDFAHLMALQREALPQE